MSVCNIRQLGTNESPDGFWLHVWNDCNKSVHLLQTLTGHVQCTLHSQVQLVVVCTEGNVIQLLVKGACLKI